MKEGKREKVKEIAITGGPGGGKSSCFDYVFKELISRGVRPFFTHEYARLFIEGGIPDILEIAKRDLEKYIEIERQMLLTHLALRKKINDTADIFFDQSRVILYDRGGMDIKAYLPQGIFEAILQDERLNLQDVRDSYDAVIFLRSAAHGAEDFYRGDDPVRLEKEAWRARIYCDETLAAWIGHPRLFVIESRENFEEKMARVLKAILNIIGLDGSYEIERKFLLEQKPDFGLGELKDAVKVSVEQIYLSGSGDGWTRRIRKTTQGFCSSYYLTRKKDISDSKMVREEEEENIGALDYIYLSRQRDPKAKVIKKDRYYFVYQNQYFELDIFREPARRRILEIELIDEKDEILLPPFLKIKREVTEEKRYSSHGIALGL